MSYVCLKCLGSGHRRDGIFVNQSFLCYCRAGDVLRRGVSQQERDMLTQQKLDDLKKAVKSKAGAKRALSEFFFDNPDIAKEVEAIGITTTSPFLLMLLPIILRFLESMLNKK